MNDKKRKQRNLSSVNSMKIQRLVTCQIEHLLHLQFWTINKTIANIVKNHCSQLSIGIEIKMLQFISEIIL